MRKLFSEKRNIIALAVFAAFLLVHIGGLVMSACFFRADMIDRAEFLHRLVYFFIGIALMAGVFLVEWIFRIRFPLYFEIVIIAFAFATNSLATVFGFYDLVPHWDKILHFVSGAIFATTGLCFADLLFRDKLEGTRKAVAFCLFAFFFALAVGYLWEMYEFLFDTFTGGDLQRWNTGLLEDLGNGTYLVDDKRGAGLLDSMMDMLMNAVCALIYCLVLFFVALKKPDILSHFRIERISKTKNAAVPTEKAEATEEKEIESPEKKE